MTDQRKTYASKAKSYELDPARVFDVVVALTEDIGIAKRRAKNDNPGTVAPATILSGYGRKLVIDTEIVKTPGLLTSFGLVELVLSPKNDKLTMKVNSHPKVTIPSEGFYYTGQSYKRK